MISSLPGTYSKKSLREMRVASSIARTIIIRSSRRTFATITNLASDDLTSEVEKIYGLLRKFNSRPEKLDLTLHDACVVVRPGLVERVLERCGDAGVFGLRFFTWASKQPSYVPSPTAYRSMIKMLCRTRQFGSVWALIDEMRRESPESVTADVFVVLIRRFASSRMVAKAVEVLDEMPKYGCEPDGHVFGCLLDALCKQGHVKEAASLFEDMKERFPPTLHHFTSLLYGWCRTGKLVEAKVVLRRMREAGFEPDVVVFNTLLSGFAAAGKMEDGYDLLREMKRKGCEPNAASYTTLMQYLCTSSRVDEAVRLFAEMERSGCGVDVVTYTTLISGFCKAGRIDRAYYLMQVMAKQGCPPNQSTYLFLFLAHEKQEKLEECLELMERMSKAGCYPDLSVYSIVIRLACKLGEVKEAVALWKEMEAGGGVSPGLDAFVIIINGFISHGWLVEACDYFKKMVGRGLLSAPQYGTLKVLLNSLVREEKLELAEDVWGCIVSNGCELNVHAWTIWIHALFSNKYVKVACLYCLDMMDAGLMPLPETFAKLMKGLKKLYHRQLAAEITEKVRTMAAERKVTFKTYKRRGVVDLEMKKLKSAKNFGRKHILCSHRHRWPDQSQGRSPPPLYSEEEEGEQGRTS